MMMVINSPMIAGIPIPPRTSSFQLMPIQGILDAFIFTERNEYVDLSFTLTKT